MCQIDVAPSTSESGLWYPGDYANLIGQQTASNVDRWRAGQLDPDFWERRGPMNFKVRTGVSTSAALTAALRPQQMPSIVDCHIVLQAVYGQALADTMGAEIMDLLHDAPLDFVVNAQPSSVEPLYFFLRSSIAAVLSTVIPNGSLDTPVSSFFRPGEWLSVEGVPVYHNKHPAGAFGGYNVVYDSHDEQTGEPLFRGFGLRKAVTLAELRQLMVLAYNEAPTPWDEELASRDPTMKSRLDRLRNHTVENTPDAIGGLRLDRAAVINTDKVQEAIRDPRRVQRDMRDHMRNMLYLGFEDLLASRHSGSAEDNSPPRDRRLNGTTFYTPQMFGAAPRSFAGASSPSGCRNPFRWFNRDRTR